MPPRRLPLDADRPIRTAGLLVVLFLVLGLTVRFACEDALGYAAIWPANGAIAVAAFVLPARLAVPAVAACAWLNVLINLPFLPGLADNLLHALLNAGRGTAAALLLRRFCGASPDLMRLRRLGSFTAIAFGVSAAGSALGEAVGPGAPFLGDIVSDWLLWTLDDALGLLIATPAILCMVGGGRGAGVAASRPAERWLLLSLAAAGTVLAFSRTDDVSFLLIYPLLVVTAFRAGAAWVLGTVLLVALIAAGLTSHGHGPIGTLAAGGPLKREMMLQCFLVSLFLVAVPTNAALRERAIAVRRLRRLKDDLQRSATRDPLTLLANRAVFQERLDALLRAGAGCTVLFIDLDRFKEVNDTLGHQAGDELLRIFGARLAGCVGGRTGAEGGVVARFGGDAFAVLIPREQEPAEVEALCAALARAARQPYPLAYGSIHVSICIGVGIGRRHGGGADAARTGVGNGVGIGIGGAVELMRQADTALYAAKKAGRDVHRVFEDGFDQGVREQRQLEEDLRAALAERDRLRLHYQLKTDRAGRPTGVEALLRWNHPRLGLVAADRVVAVAERSGLILPLGSWVLREAACFAARWPELAVAVNVSPVQLEHPEFARDVLALVAASATGVSRLELEITETSLWRDSLHVNNNLRALRDAGFRIALDDFGTGYSSLRHLHHFTVDRVKIDRSFVAGIDASAEAGAIVRAIIQLGHAMGLQVTAEGVETPAQHRVLLDAGVDEFQGYHLARPMEERRLAVSLLRRRNGAVRSLRTPGVVTGAESGAEPGAESVTRVDRLPGGLVVRRRAVPTATGPVR